MIQSQNTHSDLSVRPVDSVRDNSTRAIPVRKYLRFSEAMAYLSIKSRSTLWRYRKQYPDMLPMARFKGADGWFRVSDLDAFVEYLFEHSGIERSSRLSAVVPPSGTKVDQPIK